MNVEKYLTTFGQTWSSIQNVFNPTFKKSEDPEG